MKYFSVETDKFLACPCCGKFFMDGEFQIKLDNARELARIPFHVNSGFRCPVHNLKVGGSPTSSHLKGYAMDIQAKTDFYKYRIIMGAIMAGIKRILVYPTFVHLDGNPNKTQEIITIME